MVGAYRDLAYVERDLSHIKVDDLSLRAIHHHLEAQVRSHVFICIVAAHLVWHLREALAPLTFTDEGPSDPNQPSGPDSSFHVGIKEGRLRAQWYRRRSLRFPQTPGPPRDSHSQHRDGDHRDRKLVRVALYSHPLAPTLKSK